MSEKALNKFISKVGDIREKLNIINEYIDNHMEVSPEDVNWGHVGSASRIDADLQEILEFIGE